MKSQNIFRNVNKNLSEEDIAMLSPLQLAYIGDAVYELLVRTYLLTRDTSVNDLHKNATKFVRAKAQAKIVHLIGDDLNKVEKSLIRRGRNTKTNTSPKNTDIIDYKYSTGFESLIGFLFLTNQEERIEEIFEMIINSNASKEGDEHEDS